MKLGFSSAVAVFHDNTLEQEVKQQREEIIKRPGGIVLRNSQKIQNIISKDRNNGGQRLL